MAEPSMMEMMKQARGLQKRMNKVQKKAEKREVSAEAAGGAVSVVCTGKIQIKRILLDQELIDRGNKRELQDAVVEGVNAAIKKAQAMVEAEMGKVAADMGLPGGDDPLAEVEEQVAEESGEKGGRLRRLLGR